MSDQLRRLALASALLTAGVCLCACSQPPISAEANVAPVTLRIGSVEFNVEDPVYGIRQSARLFTREGLTGNSRDGHARPRLAESWSVSPDGLQWSFVLREDAKFHDGSPVDAVEVKKSLDQSLSSLTDRSLYPGLDDVVGIDAVGRNEVRISLRNRSTFLVDDLFVPISKIQEDGSAVGTGSFIETSVSPDQIVMHRFSEHYLGAPEIGEIIWKPYPAVRTAWAAMMRGEIDFLYQVSQESVEFVEDETTTQTFSVLRPYVFGVVFNSSMDHFQDVRVRQALNYAVDRVPILELALAGRGLVADTAIWPMHWAYDRTVSGYGYDPGRAGALLDTAGKTLGSVSAGRRLSFTCLLPENASAWERTALVVQRQLSEIGVEMNLDVVPADVFNRRIEEREFEAVFLEIVGGPSMSIPYVFWHSSSARNSFGFRSENVDSALEAIRRAPDDNSYRRAVRDLQESMTTNPPGIFLAWGQTSRALSRRFQVPDNPERADVLLSLGRWQATEPR